MGDSISSIAPGSEKFKTSEEKDEVFCFDGKDEIEVDIPVGKKETIGEEDTVYRP